LQQRAIHRRGHALGDLGLQLEPVGMLAIEAMGPQMRLILRPNQMDDDPHPIACALHLAQDHVIGPQAAMDGRDIAKAARARQQRI
jgi:hypothetical protein